VGCKARRQAPALRSHPALGRARAEGEAVRQLSKLSAEAAYSQLRALIASAPDLYSTQRTPDTQKWMGRVSALIQDTLGVSGKLTLSGYQNHLRSDIFGPEAASNIMGLLYEALAVVELELPAKAQGAFIPAGNAFDALSAVAKIFASARKDLLVVDPYLDEKILIEFAQLASEGVNIRLLSDSSGVKPTLATAAAKWKQQFPSTRPIQVRLAAARSLHDRLVLVDGGDVWTVGQSFNKLAARAPTSFGKVDDETARLKVVAYDDIWNASKEI
jgi:PLD-like domain